MDKLKERPVIQARGETAKRMVDELCERLHLDASKVIRMAIAQFYMAIMDGDDE